MNLDSFFNPKSVAIVGASDDPEKLSYGIVKNVQNIGLFEGKVYPINPKMPKFPGLQTYPSLADTPKPVDLAIIVIPAQFVVKTVAEGAEKGVKNFVIITAGFKEAGEKGLERENELIKLIKKYDLNVLGPNCLGFLQPYANLNASFAVSMPLQGKVAFASQSGALCTGILDRAVSDQLGFSYFVSIGNKAGITELDLLEYWKDDPNVDVIAFYLEGIVNGRKFLKEARKVSLKKPIIIVYPGESKETQAAISSHTGTLAGGAKAALTAFKQSGLIYTQSIEDLFDFMMIFSYAIKPQGDRLAIVTNAGGPGVLTTDLIVKQKMHMAKLDENNLNSVRNLFPEMAAVRNPFDVLGDATADRYEKAIETVLKDKNTDGAIILLTPQLKTEIRKTAESLISLGEKYNKTVIASFIGGKEVGRGLKILRQNRIPSYYYPERAVLAFKKYSDYEEWKKFENSKKKESATSSFTLSEENRTQIKKYFTNAEKRQARFLSDRECFHIAKIFGFPTPKQSFSSNINSLKDKLKNMPLPLVLKISHPEYPHKSDIGGVKVKLSNLKEIESAANQMSAKMKAQNIENYEFMLQEMVFGDYEIIMGVKKDPIFGHLIMFGAGGIYTEVYEDVSFRLAPFTRKDTEKMISETKMYHILQGLRGKEPANLELLAQILEKISTLVTEFPEIEELDFNPVIAKGNQVFVADIKIRI